MSNELIKRSAREVVDRLGAAAIEYLHARIAAIEKSGTPRQGDQTYLLLTAVEDIIEKRAV